MKNFLRYYLKYIVLAAVFIAAIAAAGISNVKNIETCEARKSSYTRTQFDYYIASPSARQAEEIEADPSVDKVFPFYAVMNAFNSNAAKDVTLLLSDDMDDSGISLITEKTCISGGYDKDGVMLDYLAAQRLRVSVGSSLTFRLKSKSFTLKVSGIYLTSTYGTLAKGIALANYTAEMKEALTLNAYGGAFLTANNKTDAEALLADYVGEGNIYLTYEEYVASYCGTKPSNQSQQEFDDECRAKYEAWCAQILAQAGKGSQVSSKEESYALVRDLVKSTEQNVDNINISMAVATGVLFLILNIVFVVTNRKNDLLRCDEGMRFIVMAGLYSITSLVTAAVIAGAGFGIIYMAAAKTFFVAECMKTALFCSLPSLIAVPLVIAFVFIYLNRMYANSAGL